uniref:MULE transposase domain-containing protein n=1 Tax=Arundo donax TaxID=35708 RepID=A0A0A9TLJ5_ARUDO
MSEVEITFSRILQESRIKPRKIMAIFQKMAGSFKNLNFGKKHVNNLKQADQRKPKNTDIESILKFFKKLQMEEPGFFYTMRTDEDNTVRSIFWTDTRSRLDYALYGDFVSFDTTFSTNKYNMPFAPIVGINGHGKNIVFGWALLENQKAETFTWLFKTFLEVMEGKKPNIIITDQDAAMKKSIKEFLETVTHRNCFWHIIRNVRVALGVLFASKEGLYAKLYSLVTQSLSEEE